MSTQTAQHLGGHFGNGHVDVGILEALRDALRLQGEEIRSAVDVGCGPGLMLERFWDRGIEALGVDGDPAVARHGVLVHDFALGPTEAIGARDLLWTTEFLEHVEERYLGNFFESVAGCRRAVVTAAPPGRGGHHHVNCQRQGYWVERFAREGWQWKPEMQGHLARASWPMLCRPGGVVTRSAAFDSLMVFKRRR